QIIAGVLLMFLFSFRMITLPRIGGDNLSCLVCGMKVDKPETYEYDKKTYYFDTYNCKETFRMNPEKFLHNVCTPAPDTTKPNH
ncbi:MAG TPA: YHS domain-containing protein, partial [Bacteroidia bacterium]|nr:YHS domain-containing protein [Bacteroidia bacterium]